MIDERDKEKEKKGRETLEDFLTNMTGKILVQQEKMNQVSTILVDLSQELGLVIMDLMKRAEDSRDDLGEALRQIRLHNKLGSVPQLEDGETLIETAWVAKGQVDGYLYAVTEIRKVCENVMGRKDETKH